jgi:hypothetical protein
LYHFLGPHRAPAMASLWLMANHVNQLGPNHTHHSRTNSTNCWNTGCSDPSLTCFVRDKTAKGGYGQCHHTCPHGWNCETRGQGGCGAAPLPKVIVPPSLDAGKLVAPYQASICDRRNPPVDGPHAVFTLECYDGGFTGNRYMMVRNLLERAICCAGVALFPPSFDGMPDAGASCFDFRARQQLPSVPSAELQKACRSTSASSSAWWAKLRKQTPSNCSGDASAAILNRLTASLYAGFGVPAGRVMGDECSADLQQDSTLVMHIRSGDLFTDWKDGERIFTHKGYNSDMSHRGQPPLAFYLRAMAHALPAPPEPPGVVYLVTSPDLANPVVKLLKHQAQLHALRYKLVVSASSSLQDDLKLLLCARNLVLAASSMGTLFMDGPRLRKTYSFHHSCHKNTTGQNSYGNVALAPEGQCESAPAWCVQNATCTGAYGVQNWCVHPEQSYSPLSKWNNSDAQQVEMLLADASVPTPTCTM